MIGIILKSLPSFLHYL